MARALAAGGAAMHRLQRTSVAPLPRFNVRSPRKAPQLRGWMLPLLAVVLVASMVHLGGVSAAAAARAVACVGGGGHRWW